MNVTGQETGEDSGPPAVQMVFRWGVSGPLSSHPFKEKVTATRWTYNVVPGNGGPSALTLTCTVKGWLHLLR